jgi:hypothetical protein
LFTNVIRVEELESYDSQDENRELADKEARRIKFRFLGLLGQGYNIVVYIRGSPGCTEEFRVLAKRLILLDNCTR